MNDRINDGNINVIVKKCIMIIEILLQICILLQQHVVCFKMSFAIINE